MDRYKQIRYVLITNGRRCSFHIIKGRVIPADPKRIAKINAELRKKCEKQKENDAEALIEAKELWAGK